jgi:transcriptional regulator with AAA-type ATPase domain
MTRLQVMRGEELLVEHRLSGGRTTIGRADHTDLALPGAEVSRVHCHLQAEDEGWVVVDRSRHGCFIDGQKVEGKATLRPGSTLLVGPYSLRLRPTDEGASPTAAAAPERAFERVEAEGGEVRVERLCLRLCTGPEAGARLALRAARVSVGGPGSQLVVARDGLLAQHAFLRLSQGRVMVEPGAGATFVNNARVRDITPLWPGEPLRLGHVEMAVEVEAAGPAAPAERFGELRARAPEMQRLIGTLRRMAGHHFTVLVVGESGTGKELIARGVHEASPRARGPYVPLNCGAISPALFESALFGHEKGAFTGADARRDGAFHQAEGGTLFLDEVGELPEEAQAKLLRALETGEVRRVGSAEVSWPDVRVVAATNRDLPAMVRAGRFREDLYYRLAVLSVEVPPLRDRMEDIPLLVEGLCHRLHPALRVDAAAMERLSAHCWPGNVRELRNVLTRAWVLGGNPIRAAHLTISPVVAAQPPPVEAYDPAPEDERARLVDVLQQVGENRSAAARALGIPRTSLHYRLKRHGLT